MKKHLIVCALVAASAVSGCATIIDGSTQDIAIATTDNTAANCVVNTANHQVFNVTAPTTVKLDKGNAPITVECKNDSGQQGKASISESLNPWFFGNILIGGPLGMVIDGVSGGYQEYDSKSVSVPLTGNAAATKPTTATPKTADKK